MMTKTLRNILSGGQWRRTCGAAATLVVVATATPAQASTAEPPAVRYDAAGQALLPEYRQWVFLTAGLDMSYQPASTAADGHSFDNVFASPAAYRAFQATGHWPEGTVLAKESRAALTKGSINKAGHFQSEAVDAVEIHVKDSARFPGGWGFFIFAGTHEAAVVPKDAECYACHREHGATETTFVQFYPTLVPIARANGTLKASEDVARSK